MDNFYQLEILITRLCTFGVLAVVAVALAL